MRHSRYCVVDIEAIARPDWAEFVDPVTAPSNYRDQAKIDAYIAEKQADRKPALDIYLAKPVVIGVLTEMMTRPQAWTITTDVELIDSIATLWSLVMDTGGTLEVRRPLVTYNGLRYDLPLLLHWSRLLGIDAPPFELRYGQTQWHVDVYDWATFSSREVQSGGVMRRSLKRLAQLYGVDLPDTDLDGSQVAAAVATGRLDVVADHCVADVWRTHRLAERLGIVRPVAYDDVEVA